MVTFGKVKATPFVSRQPVRLMAAVSLFRSSIHSWFVAWLLGWNMISLMTILSAKTAFGLSV